MKKLFAWIALAFLSVCCAPPRASVPDATTVTVWRDFELVLHVDHEFNAEGRKLIEKAAASIRRLTHDRARLTVVFDLDFSSLENLAAHKDARHSKVIGVVSHFDIVRSLDKLMPGDNVLAATAPMKDGSIVVFLILDRIADDRFESVVTHEFGHVIGFPDLDAFGAIMSGRDIVGAPAIQDWTPADVALCKSFGYCT